MRNELSALCSFLEGCRRDMQEPDKQGVSVTLSGEFFDNAMGNDPTAQEGLSPEAREIIVTFVKEVTEDEGDIGGAIPVHEAITIRKEISINLATLVALARYADLHGTEVS